MKYYGDFSELPGVTMNNVGKGETFQALLSKQNDLAQPTDNAVFVGEADPWNKFDALKKQEAIEIIEKKAMRTQDELRALDHSVTEEERNVNRERIKNIILKVLGNDKDKYVLLKQELLEIGIDTLSDIRLLDAYYDEETEGK